MFKLLKYLLSARTVKSFSELETFQYGAGFYHKNQRFIPHTSLHLSESAVFRSSPAQIIIACIVVGFFIINFFVFPRATLVLAITCMTLLYFIDLIFNLFLIYRSFAKSPEIVLTPEQLATQRDWPSYTILCPLYKEAEVLPQFVSAMNQLDYPDEKLQILLLLEYDSCCCFLGLYCFRGALRSGTQLYL